MYFRHEIRDSRFAIRVSQETNNLQSALSSLIGEILCGVRHSLSLSLSLSLVIALFTRPTDDLEKK